MIDDLGSFFAGVAITTGFFLTFILFCIGFAARDKCRVAFAQAEEVIGRETHIHCPEHYIRVVSRND